MYKDGTNHLTCLQACIIHHLMDTEWNSILGQVISIYLSVCPEDSFLFLIEQAFPMLPRSGHSMVNMELQETGSSENRYMEINA